MARNVTGTPPVVGETDVVVVGGGVAGAATARRLAEAGHHVVVLDSARFPRDKACGEGVMPTGVRELEQLGILGRIPPAERHPIHGVRFVVGGARVQGDFPDMGGGHRTGLGLRRLLLDQLVLGHARAHPRVTVHEGEPVLDVRCDRDAAEVVTRSGRHRARLVIGADGISSLVRRRLGLERPRSGRQRYGLRAHYRVAVPPPTHVSVHVEPEGEIYLTPVGAATVQITLLMEKPAMRRFAGQLEAEYESFLAGRRDLQQLLAGAQRISPVLTRGPFDVWARCRVADRALLVGDAGGYLDPITGEGVSLALQASAWAAEAAGEALRAGDLSRDRLLPYHHRVERAMRHYKVLTRTLLWLTRHPRLAAWVARRLDGCQELYGQLLAINCGARTFWDLRAADLCRFCLARP